ncbi:OTU-like cysteine protease family protein, putative (macronuclear) [Tetrahymena thermophila SB210]|uniref:OTU-like cysteine protease family protein, putative n=1 Tax=Tetrahymena thermophila (strain SB210) TaxID=312017 RepID=Q22UJ7_TETTS|nr:OTU-like cysteine protease family protein, putative [Tetrahymena thermophila SB210]EAR88973.2 OTU-like cysteine protease family protein, putative [Tetrahymena thermophila SB210]|eukprot:XP_001009218.2 OTU-like cysteine protease family protein, putative [Tetrahymena thermophila SB210]
MMKCQSIICIQRTFKEMETVCFVQLQTSWKVMKICICIIGKLQLINSKNKKNSLKILSMIQNLTNTYMKCLNQEYGVEIWKFKLFRLHQGIILSSIQKESLTQLLKARLLKGYKRKLFIQHTTLKKIQQSIIAQLEISEMTKKEMNKDDVKECIEIQDNQSEENDENTDQIQQENKDIHKNETKKSKQSKIEIAKLKKEKEKQKKAERQTQNQKREKTHKSKKQQVQDNSEEQIDVGDGDDIEQNENQENYNADNSQEKPLEQNENINQENMKRKEEKKIKDLVWQLASIQLQEDVSNNKIEGQSKLIKLGRNQKCHCGSLKPYKKCCESKDLINNQQNANKIQNRLDNLKDVVFI